MDAPPCPLDLRCNCRQGADAIAAEQRPVECDARYGADGQKGPMGGMIEVCAF